jgi:hypothetical protein
MSKKTSKKPVPANNNRTTKVGGNNKKVKKSPLIKSSKQELAWRIPECVHHFMHALVDPFEAPAGACLPCDLFPLPSSKFKVFVRGRMNLGTSGIGFAVLTPTAANDSSFLQTTTSTSVLPSNAALTTATNLQNLLCTQNQFIGGSFGANQVAVRLVSFGLRAKYVGQLMDRNGVVTAYEDPDHQDARRFSYDQLNSNPYSDIHRVGSEQWDASVCSSGPVTPGEVEFLNTNYPLGSTTAPIVLAVSGVAGDLYEVEGYCHYELIGLLVPNKTKSHAEPGFFGKVIEAAKSITDSGPLSPSKGPSLWERFTSSVREGLPQIVGTIGNAIAPGVGSVMGLLTKSLAGPPPDSVFNRQNYSQRAPQMLTMG